MNNRYRYDLIGTELFKLVVHIVCACTQNVLMETTFVLCILSRDSRTRHIALARRTECSALLSGCLLHTHWTYVGWLYGSTLLII